jgi:hypothetical protein
VIRCATAVHISSLCMLHTACSRDHTKHRDMNRGLRWLLQDAADRQLAAALVAADAALMQHSQAAFSQQTLAMQTADEQYRCSMLAPPGSWAGSVISDF